MAERHYHYYRAWEYGEVDFEVKCRCGHKPSPKEEAEFYKGEYTHFRTLRRAVRTLGLVMNGAWD